MSEKNVAQFMLERRQRTDPPGELDACAPDRGGQVRPGQPGPAEHEQASERHESGERQVQDYDKVREQGAHRSIVLSCGRNVLACRSHERCP